MKSVYIATQNNHESIIGSIKDISNTLKVSRAYVHKCYKNDLICKGWRIYFLDYKTPKEKISQKDKFRNAIDIIKRARIIINESNEYLSNNNEYSNIGIIEDIDRFLESLGR